MADCPHCGLETKLYIPPISKVPVTAAGRSSGNSVDSGLVVCGWVFAILIPLIGFVIGIYLMANKQPGRGLAMMVTSCLVSAIVWFLIMPDIFGQ
jgi:hypothetical protein